MSIQDVSANCNLMTLRDGRGGIFTYYPDDPIVEWNLLFTRAGESRGFHFHKEFDESSWLVFGMAPTLRRRRGRTLTTWAAASSAHMPMLRSHKSQLALSHTSAAVEFGLRLHQPDLSKVHVTRLGKPIARTTHDVVYHRMPKVNGAVVRASTM